MEPNDLPIVCIPLELAHPWTVRNLIRRSDSNPL